MKFLNSLNDVFDIIDRILDKIASPIYYWLIVLLYFLYLAVFFGLFYMNAKYLNHLSIFIQIFIAVVLIIRFNPLRNHVVKSSDSTIIFASAFFLLMNVGLTETLGSYVKQIWKNNNIPPLHV
jgi:hypothetical protein